MARDTSLFHAFACALADRLTRNALNREAEYLTMVSLIYAQAASVFGGERIYGPRTNQVEREQARLRIAQAIEQGQDPVQIARTERVHPATVRRIRARIRP